MRRDEEQEEEVGGMELMRTQSSLCTPSPFLHISSHSPEFHTKRVEQIANRGKLVVGSNAVCFLCESVSVCLRAKSERRDTKRARVRYKTSILLLLVLFLL